MALQVIVICGGRPLTNEEWEIVKPRIDSGGIVIASHSDEMKNLSDKLDLADLMKYEEIDMIEPIHSDNHYWKKSNKNKHPAFRK